MLIVKDSCAFFFLLLDNRLRLDSARELQQMVCLKNKLLRTRTKVELFLSFLCTY